MRLSSSCRVAFLGIRTSIVAFPVRTLTLRSCDRENKTFPPKFSIRFTVSESLNDKIGDSNQVLEEAPLMVAGERLAKMIARTGVCGRREAEKRILEKRVSVNGRIVSDVGQRVLQTDEVWMDEYRLHWNKSYAKLRLWAVNKPAGDFVALADPIKKRRLLYDRLAPLIAEVGELKPVAHLEYMSEGLMLLTNNGMFAKMLASPELGLKRVYRVKVHGLVTESKLHGLKRGLVIDGIKYSSMTCNVDRKLATNSWITVRCLDMKAKQIQKCFANLHLKATKTISTEFGPYKLGPLKEGTYEEVKVLPSLEKAFYGGKRGLVKATVGNAASKKSRVKRVVGGSTDVNQQEREVQKNSEMSDSDFEKLMITHPENGSTTVFLNSNSRGVSEDREEGGLNRKESLTATGLKRLLLRKLKQKTTLQQK